MSEVERRPYDANENPYRRSRDATANIQNFAGISDEDRAMILLDAEYKKERMDNMARIGVVGGFFNRRDNAAVRAIVAAMQEARNRA